MKAYAALAAAAVVLFAMPAVACDHYLSDEELMLTEQKSEAELLAMIKDSEAQVKAAQIAETPDPK